MSDNLKLSMRIDAHDEASSILRKLRAEVKALQTILGKSFGNSSAGVANVKAFAANQAKATDAVLKFSKAETSAVKFKARFEAGLRRDRERDAAATAKAQSRAEKAGIRAIGETIKASARLARQKVADEQAASRASVRSIGERMAFANRMTRQRMSEERVAAREAARGERERSAAIRETAKLGVFRMRLRERHEADLARQSRSARSTAARSGREAFTRGRESYQTLTRTGGAAGIAATAGTGALVRRSLGVEGDIDAAEVNSRIYGGLSKQAARDLREKWAEPLAEKLGIGTSKLLESYVDALKLGIPSEGARSFAGLATKTSEAWGVSFEQVSEILGTVNSILTSTGDAFDFGKIQSTANAIQYLAQKQSTTPEKLISFLQRGAGASQILGMSQSAGVAFGGASTSLGNQSAESGRLMDYVASKLIDLPQLVKKHGDEGKQARELVRALGYGSAGEMDRQRRADPDSFLPDFFERFNKISDPKVQERGMRSFFGREWLGEGGRMVKGVATYKESARLEKESRNIDSIEEVWKLHVEKLAFTGKQITSGFKNVLGVFGKELSPIARQFGDYFLGWTEKLRSGGLSARIKASLQGLVEGFGFQDVPSMLKGVLGDPNDANGGSIEAWRSTFREFGAGLKDVFSTIKSMISAFTGDSPETIARWTGRILALTSALLVLSPVVSVLGALATGVLALSAALRGAGALLTALGLGKAAAPAAPAATAATGVLGRLGSLLGVAGSAAAAPLTLDPSKADNDAMMLRLGAWAKGRLGKDPDQPAGSWVDPPGKALKGALDDHARVLKQSLESGSGLRGLIHKTGLDGADVRDLKQIFSAQGARLQLASLTSGTAGGLAGSGSGSFAGGSGAAGSFGGSGASSMLGNVPGQAFGGGGSRRGILGGGGPSAGGSSANLSGDAKERAMQYYAGLRAGGLDAVHANALMGHAMQETGGTFSGSSWNAKEGAGGMLQYRGNRLANLQKFAKSIGKDWRDPYTQGLFGGGKEREMDPYEAKRAQGFLNAKDLSTATREAGRNVVRFGDSTGPYRERMARSFADGSAYEAMSGGTATAGSNAPGRGSANFMRGQYGGPGTNQTTISTYSGKRLTVHREAAESFRGFVNELESTGYKVKSLAGYNLRRIRGGSGWSQHAYGNAIDINPAANPMGYGPLKTDLPANVSDMAAKWGLSWGGDWKRRKDAMHFEWNGTRPWESTAKDLASKAQPSPEALAKTVPAPAANRMGDSMMGKGGGGPAVHAPISIQGGNTDPETLANLVQKRLQDTLNTRTHDQSYRSI